ncbi:mating type protein [Emericellopsis atlantica]|uniref:Mating type protein n=1 Tax=Emericellopsis atlantica TaxID=2614577 RepID=A0A9P7ZM73_9HYPO|nr:mating type protein [Emericellopsis atlantica]KAG9254150.1 mating type protein [Emericellopsis atlantica]
MSSRSQIIESLSLIPTAELLNHLDEDTLFSLSEQYCKATMRSHITQDRDAKRSLESNAVTVPPTPKTKRPLNGFMAFRSYYLKMFPEVQQKSISGFLQSLWSQDPYRNRWALVAKVYSFIRDEIGKERIPLSNFLSTCCPIMKIIEPSTYLPMLGWHITEVPGGNSQLIRHDSSVGPAHDELEIQNYPRTEFDLLCATLSAGFLPTHSSRLIQKLSSKRSCMIDASSRSSRKGSKQVLATKSKFIHTIQKNPLKAAQDVFASSQDDSTLHETGYRVLQVDSLQNLDHLPLNSCEPPKLFSFPTTHAHMGFETDAMFNFEQIPEHDCYDLGDPYEMGNITNLTGAHDTQGIHLHQSPPFSPGLDFQQLF